MAKVKTPLGLALTGSGHFFKECPRMLRELDDVDLFLSKTASEVVRMYRQEFKCRQQHESSAIRRLAPRQ